MKKKTLFLFALFFTMITVVSVFGGTIQAQAASAKTGAGLSDHVILAHQNDWQYAKGCYGQFVNGKRATDCSGLIKSYLWWQGENKSPKSGSVSVAGGSSGMLSAAKVSGTINYSDKSSLPRVHGLILYEPGHVGVYIGNNLAIDNRDYGDNTKCENVFGRKSTKWTKWFKLPQITYPTTGWETFNGEKYYYENGQYVINTIKNIDGIAYTFGEDGTIIEENEVA